MSKYNLFILNLCRFAFAKMLRFSYAERLKLHFFCKFKQSKYTLIFIINLCLINCISFAQSDTSLSSTSNIIIRDSILQYELDAKLIIAAEEGSTEDVLSLIKNGANVNAKTDEGVTSLMYASQNGYLEVVQILIYNGADVNAVPNDGSSALIAATRFNHVDVMDTLIRHGAEVDKKNNDGYTALMYAVEYNYFIPVDMLLFYGADVNVTKTNSTTLLMIACENAYKDIVELLINKGADIFSSDEKEQTALHYAVIANNLEIVKILVQQAIPVNEKNNIGYSALALSAENGNSEIGEYLITHGVDASKSTSTYSNSSSSNTPFRIALNYENKSFMKMLKKNGINEYMPLLKYLQITPIDIDFNLRDLLYGVHIGVHEVRYKISFGLGYNTRLWANRIIVPISDNLNYQLWETRSFLYFNVSKVFEISNDNDLRQGIFLDAKILYTYGKYRALNLKPDDKFIFVPALGYSIYGDGGGIKFSYEYLDLKIKNLSPHRYKIGAFFNIDL